MTTLFPVCSCSYPLPNATSFFTYMGSSLSSPQTRNNSMLSTTQNLTLTVTPYITASGYESLNITTNTTIIRMSTLTQIDATETTYSTDSLQSSMASRLIASLTVTSSRTITSAVLEPFYTILTTLTTSVIVSTPSPTSSSLIIPTPSLPSPTLSSSSASSSANPSDASTSFPIPSTSSSRSRSSLVLPIVIPIICLVVIPILLGCFLFLLRRYSPKLYARTYVYCPIRRTWAAIVPVWDRTAEVRHCNRQIRARSRAGSCAYKDEKAKSLGGGIEHKDASDAWPILDKHHVIGGAHLSRQEDQGRISDLPAGPNQGPLPQRQSNQVSLGNDLSSMSSIRDHDRPTRARSPEVAEYAVTGSNPDGTLQDTHRASQVNSNDNAILPHEIIMREETLKKAALERFRQQDLMNMEQRRNAVQGMIELGRKLRGAVGHTDINNLKTTRQPAEQHDRAQDRIESNQSCEVRRSMESDCLREYFNQLDSKGGEVVFDRFRKWWEGKT